MIEKSIFKDGANKNLTHPKNVKGITLIALVITIIVLLILAGVSITMLTGENGILTQANNAKTKTLAEEEKEQIAIAFNGVRIAKLADGNNSNILASELQKELRDNGITGAQVNGEGTLTVTMISGNQYTVTQKGKIDEKDTAVDTGYDGILQVPENPIYTFAAGENITAYVVESENQTAGSETTEYDILFIGTGEMSSLVDWETDFVNAHFETMISNWVVNYAVPVKQAKISNGIVNIGEKAFFYNYILEEVKIPSSVTSIENSAFYDCSNLTSIDIPNSVTRIGISAFTGCRSLTSINIPYGVTTIESDVFTGCSNMTNINIPTSVTNIDNSAFSVCSSLTSINIPPKVTNIGNMAFYRCENLASIEIPSSVTTIGYNAFDLCDSLTSITVKKEENSIADAPWKAPNATVYWEP